MVDHIAGGTLSLVPSEEPDRLDLQQYRPVLVIQAAAIVAVAPDRQSVAVHDVQGNLLRVNLDRVHPAHPPMIGDWAIRHPTDGWGYQSAADFERDWNPVHGPRLS
jgi:hypothetical protein